MSLDLISNIADADKKETVFSKYKSKKYDENVSVVIESNKNCTGLLITTGVFLHYKQEDYNKFINVKVPKVGNIHISGARKDVHVFKAFHFVINYMNKINKEKKDSIYTIIRGKRISGVVNRIMTNVKTHCNFTINRENLNRHIPNLIPSSHSFFDPSLRYPGVIVTLSIDMPRNMKSIQLKYNEEANVFNIKNISYAKYIKKLKKNNTKKKIKSLTKDAKFMVFKKGVIIITCPYQELIPKLLDYFVRTLKTNRNVIEYT